MQKEHNKSEAQHNIAIVAREGPMGSSIWQCRFTLYAIATQATSCHGRQQACAPLAQDLRSSRYAPPVGLGFRLSVPLNAAMAKAMSLKAWENSIRHVLYLLVEGSPVLPRFYLPEAWRRCGDVVCSCGCDGS